MKYKDIKGWKGVLLSLVTCGDPVAGIREINLEDAAEIIPKLKFLGYIDSSLQWAGDDFTLEIIATDSGLDYNDPHMEAYLKFKEDKYTPDNN